MGFGNERTHNRWDISWFLLLVILSLPWTLSRCVVDPKDLCEFVCEEKEGKEFITINKGFFNRCVCGRRLPNRPIEIRGR